MRVICERSSCSFDSSGVSISTSGPCTNTLGPVRVYGIPFSRASTQTAQEQCGRGVVVAPPEPRTSTCIETGTYRPRAKVAVAAGRPARGRPAACGRYSPGTWSRASRHEILPENPVPGPTSPAEFGELSRRLPSELVVQSVRPERNGLVGSSSGPALRSVGAGALRKNSPTRPCRSTTAIAFRSLASTHTLPARSSAIPSAPSSAGCWTNSASRHSVSGAYVVSHPVEVWTGCDTTYAPD